MEYITDLGNEKEQIWENATPKRYLEDNKITITMLKSVNSDIKYGKVMCLILSTLLEAPVSIINVSPPDSHHCIDSKLIRR